MPRIVIEWKDTTVDWKATDFANDERIAYILAVVQLELKHRMKYGRTGKKLDLLQLIAGADENDEDLRTCTSKNEHTRDPDPTDMFDD